MEQAAKPKGLVGIAILDAMGELFKAAEMTAKTQAN